MTSRVNSRSVARHFSGKRRKFSLTNQPSKKHQQSGTYRKTPGKIFLTVFVAAALLSTGGLVFGSAQAASVWASQKSVYGAHTQEFNSADRPSLFRPMSPQRLLPLTLLAEETPRIVEVRDAPIGAVSAWLNVTASRTETPASVFVCPVEMSESDCRLTPVVTTQKNVSSTNGVFVPIGFSKKIQILASKNLRVVVDNFGFSIAQESAAPDDARYVPVARGTHAVTTKVDSHTPRVVTLSSVPRGAQAVAVAVDAHAWNASSDVSVCSADDARDDCLKTSIVHPAPKTSQRGFVIVPLGGQKNSQIQLLAKNGRGAVELDVLGYFRAGDKTPQSGQLRGLTAQPQPEQLQTSDTKISVSRLGSVSKQAKAVLVKLTVSGAKDDTKVSACFGEKCHPVTMVKTRSERAKTNTILLPIPRSGNQNFTIRSRGSAVTVSAQAVAEVTNGVSKSFSRSQWRVAAAEQEANAVFAKPLNPQSVLVPAIAPGVVAKTVATAAVATVASPTAAADAVVVADTGTSAVAPRTITGPAGPHNTGVPAGVALRKFAGDFVADTPGQVVDGLDISGRVSIKAPNVTIRNTIIRGGDYRSPNPMVGNSHDYPHLQIIDSEIAPSHPSYFTIAGFIGSNATLLRVNIHGSVDGVHLDDGNVTVQDSWIHDLSHYVRDPFQGNQPSHDDVIQIIGGSNYKIVGNTLSGAKNSGIQLTQDKGIVSNVLIQANTIDGGGCTVNLSEKPRGSLKGIRIFDNLFGRHTKVPNCGVISPSSTRPELRNNFYTPDHKAVTLRPGD